MFVIRSQKLAGYLMQKGFPLIKMDEDRNQTGRNVFLFKNTNQLRNEVQLFKVTKGENVTNDRNKESERSSNFRSN